MSISQLSNALGLVDRIPDPDGGIARKFRITAKGQRLMDAHRAQNNRGLDRILQDWTPEEVVDFANLLTRFNRDIERLEGRPWPRPHSMAILGG